MAAVGHAPECAGCDYKREFYLHKSKRSVAMVDKRYQDVKVASYGDTYTCIDTSLRHRVRITSKLSTKDSSMVWLGKARVCLRELTILRHVGGHENIVGISDVIIPPPVPRGSLGGPSQRGEVCFASPRMDVDMAAILRSRQELTDDHAKYFTYQLMRGLKYIHSAGVVHRDLKPGNVHCNADCDLAMCQFGKAVALGRPTGDGGKPVDLIEKHSELEDDSDRCRIVVARHYDSPEAMISCGPLSGAMDVWSVGCILAEILGKRPMFAGHSTVDQLEKILAAVGCPSGADGELDFVSNHAARRFLQRVQSTHGHERANLGSLIPGANPLALDLLDKIFQFDPSRRITAEEALAHPYLAELHDKDNEPSAPVLDRAFIDDLAECKEHELLGMLEEESKRLWRPVPAPGPGPGADGGAQGAGEGAAGPGADGGAQGAGEGEASGDEASGGEVEVEGAEVDGDASSGAGVDPDGADMDGNSSPGLPDVDPDGIV